MTIDLHPRRVAYYGCVRCQKQHEEDDPLFWEHIYWQSKHGVQEYSDPTKWVAHQEPWWTKKPTANGI